MPTADVVLNKITPLSKPTTSGRTLAAGVALSSFSALLLELALTRLFSVGLFYHFAFLAISIALLGLGAGGVLAHLRKQWLRSYDLRSIAMFCSALNALLVPAALQIILHVPVSLSLTPVRKNGTAEHI